MKPSSGAVVGIGPTTQESKSKRWLAARGPRVKPVKPEDRKGSRSEPQPAHG